MTGTGQLASRCFALPQRKHFVTAPLLPRAYPRVSADRLPSSRRDLVSRYRRRQ
ncbi:unnamed protein product [Coffea canephora]|uniref:DH200=94 genomic scaffold, scaffold_402 n=1 Tax=Coffea canephora TaxID=49390 RepID=A0A068VEY0_COFCA|nr:unnamed protein product [Coffea canephora]